MVFGLSIPREFIDIMVLYEYIKDTYRCDLERGDNYYAYVCRPENAPEDAPPAFAIRIEFNDPIIAKRIEKLIKLVILHQS